MEAIRALIRGDLPPVGSAIAVSSQSDRHAMPQFNGYEHYWVDSGTSALALALIATKKRHAEVLNPEVIVPGYCCPDLVAAANFAGIKVVAVDITANDPAVNLEHLAATINNNTIAIVAVAFLGIRENLAAIKNLLSRHPQVCLIEDNAQWFPQPEEQTELAGDFVVFSFGRGKPVSLLAGGLLLAKNIANNITASLVELRDSNVSLQVKFLAYNILRQPRFYSLLHRNPLLKLGETRYHPLKAVFAMDKTRRNLLTVNTERYWKRSRNAEKFFDDAIGTFRFNNELTALNDRLRRRRLLRYPLLLNNQTQRNELLVRLNRSGLGASYMYQKPLVDIEGVPPLLVPPTGLSNATTFAQRLITLPVHDGVNEQHLERIARHIEAVIG